MRVNNRSAVVTVSSKDIHPTEDRIVNGVVVLSAENAKKLANKSGSVQATHTTGLGDWTEQLLKSVGVTQDRYKAAKEFAGLAPTCSCDKRKEWLNKVSDWWRGQ